MDIILLTKVLHLHNYFILIMGIYWLNGFGFLMNAQNK
jgi:hypothetical protein